METTQTLRAARKFGPGYFIREQMELREWTQEDLAEVMGITLKHINKILQDKQPITLETARILSEVFNTSAQYWMNLDTAYRLWKEQEKSEKEIEADIKSMIYERMPVRDMVRKGWIPPFSSTQELKAETLRFWGWGTLDFSKLDRQNIPCYTRKSTAYHQFNASYALTWYQMARNIAESTPRRAYSKTRLMDLYEQLHRFTTDQYGIPQFLAELEQCGVVFFVLPHLQKTYLDGAAFLSGENPVIVYTGRYKRIDNFWFTVAHEIAHVLKHLNAKSPFILDDLKDGEQNEIEEEANAMAAEKLRHDEITKFLDPYLNYLSASRVEECAARYEVHPSIIIGKLTHDKKLSYKNIYLYNEDVLALIPGKYRL
ncbi:MAG: HigA family addiction module antidote protein [Bacteroidales bacterium]|nr:HigA family addiction module antidote protein [Bacteroidales bacterium]